MGYINIFIANKCKIGISNHQLLLSGDRDRKYSLQDINSIMIESRECIITSFALSELVVNDIAVFVCDAKHMPVGVCIPYNTHFQLFDTYKLQTQSPKPLIKRIWQSIIKGKISNEINCLDLLNMDGGEELSRISRDIQSGDATNGEAYAALVYFRRLFGSEFTRSEDNIINAALNYTYAIVRGLIARSIVSYGFLPYLGLHHRSTLNGYNLADDIIEPFRAICDYYVISSIDGEEELSTTLKGRLYNIVNLDVLIGDERHSLSNAVDRMIVSLKNCLTNGNSDIMLPILIGNSIHRYE